MKEVNDFEIIPGTGVKGKIRNDELIAGNRKILNKTYETELDDETQKDLLQRAQRNVELAQATLD